MTLGLDHWIKKKRETLSSLTSPHAHFFHCRPTSPTTHRRSTVSLIRSFPFAFSISLTHAHPTVASARFSPNFARRPRISAFGWFRFPSLLFYYSLSISLSISLSSSSCSSPEFPLTSFKLVAAGVTSCWLRALLVLVVGKSFWRIFGFYRQFLITH